MMTLTGVEKGYSPNAAPGRSTPNGSLKIDPKVANTRHIKTSINENIVHVVLKDREIVDEGLIHHVGEDLFRLEKELAKPENKKIFDPENVVFVVDFKNVTEQKAGFMQKLLTLDKNLRHNKVANNLTLCNMASHILEVYEITKLRTPKLLTIHTNGGGLVPDKD